MKQGRLHTAQTRHCRHLDVQARKAITAGKGFVSADDLARLLPRSPAVPRTMNSIAIRVGCAGSSTLYIAALRD